MNGKLLVTIVAIIAAILAICNFDSGVKENFWGNPARTWKVSREVKTDDGHFFSIPGTYQSMLSPRFSNQGYSSNIRYNMASEKHLAVPCDPLSMSRMVKENYCSRCSSSHGVSGCLKGGVGPANVPASRLDNVMGANYADPSFHAAKGSLDYTEVTDMLPAGDMTSVNALGEMSQPIIYDRMIFANKKSVLRGLGDPIRGDLAIMPCAPGWFRPSVHPHIDLREGAINVMAGVDNGTSRALGELQNAASGGLLTTMGGVDFASDVNMANGTFAELSAAQTDVSLTAFP